MTGRALVIHGDHSQLRFVSEALVMFRPGFHVVSASDLDAAAEWMEAADPDIVVVDTKVADPASIRAWWEANGLAQRTTIGLGVGPEGLPDMSAIVSEPVTLPRLLNEVRSVAQNRSAEQTV